MPSGEPGSVHAPATGAAAPCRTSRLQALARTFLKFAGVGAIATGIQYGILATLVECFHAEPAISSAAGFATSSLVNYALNHRFTFKSTAAHRAALPKFALVAGVGLLLNTALMYLLTRRLEVQYLLSQILTTGIVLGWNFTANHRWSFKDSRSAEGGAA